MAIETRKEVPNGTVEFDLLIDGKYQRRIGEGILYESNGFGEGNLMIACKTSTVFGLALSITRFIHENNMDEAFEQYVKMVSK